MEYSLLLSPTAAFVSCGLYYYNILFIDLITPNITVIKIT